MNIRIRYIIIICLLQFVITNTQAQSGYLRSDFALHSSSFNTPDTYQSNDTSVYVHSPKRAALLSLVPGLGQAYNKKYWKIPIIYAGLGTATYFMIKHNNTYQSFRTDYVNKLDTAYTGGFTYPEYDANQLKEEKNYYWKQRDRLILVMAGIYILNIVDATVDAHLYTFDISDDLSMRIEPDIQFRHAFVPKETYGVRLSFKF